MNNIKIFFKKRILFILIFTIFVCTSVSSISNIMSFQSYIEELTIDLVSLIFENEELAVRSKLEEVHRDSGRILSVHTSDGRTVNISTVSTSLCVGSIQKDILYMGVKLGSISGCTLLKPFTYSVLTSSIFYLAFLIIQFFGFVYIFLAKSETENNLFNLIRHLQRPRVEYIGSHQYRGKKTKLFLEIENLIVTREMALQDAATAEFKLINEIAVSQVAKQVSHDIRSPISALNMVASTLDQSDSRTQMIVGATKRINEIAEDLLNESRRTASLVSEKLNLDEVVIPIIKEYEYTYQFKFVMENFVSGSVFCSRIEFQRVLANIFQNSIDALAGKITNDSIEILTRDTGEYLVLIVSDRGLGFDKLIIENLGKRMITLGKEAGNGLGLLSAFYFMKKNNGKMEISNTTNGANVCLYFPKV